MAGLVGVLESLSMYRCVPLGSSFRNFRNPSSRLSENFKSSIIKLLKLSQNSLCWSLKFHNKTEPHQKFFRGSIKTLQKWYHLSLKKKTPSLAYGCFLKCWYPQIIHFNRVFHYKPSILGYPYFWSATHINSIGDVAADPSISRPFAGPKWRRIRPPGDAGAVARDLAVPPQVERAACPGDPQRLPFLYRCYMYGESWQSWDSYKNTYYELGWWVFYPLFVWKFHGSLLKPHSYMFVQWIR